MHQYDEALTSYNARADAAVTAAKLYPGGETARLVATCYLTVSIFNSSDEIRNFPSALKANQSRIDALRPLVERDNPASQDVNNLAQAYGNQSWFEILLGDFPGALKDSETALKIDPLQVWILGNQAHALLFLHRIEEAKEVYLKYTKGGKDDARYQKSVFDDFTELRKVRPPNADLKLLDDMENFLLTKGGYAKPTEKASNSSNK
jgi:tetratricopeptide (TPR) repeat protein